MNVVDIISAAVRVVVIFSMVMSLVPILIWMERKGAAYIQDRRGPNRAQILGIRLWGIIHSLADAVKLLTKEDVTVAGAYKPLAILAPILAFFVATSALAVVPFAEPFGFEGVTISLQIADLKVGLIYVFAMSSLGVYAIMLAGWASNNSFTMLGAMRAASQMISYELAMGMAALSIFILSGSFSLSDIIVDQGAWLWRWNIVRQPLAFIIFFTAMLAETNRLPFDLPEGESELVAGFHTEYSSMRFALFFMGEYAHIIVGSAIAATIFLGGWQIPFVKTEWLREQIPDIAVFALQLIAMFAKVIFFCITFIWIRWTLPRFRYDQLMRLGWKVLLPLGMANAVVTAIAVLFFGE